MLVYIFLQLTIPESLKGELHKPVTYFTWRKPVSFRTEMSEYQRGDWVQLLLPRQISTMLRHTHVHSGDGLSRSYPVLVTEWLWHFKEIIIFLTWYFFGGLYFIDVKIVFPWWNHVQIRWINTYNAIKQLELAAEDDCLYLCHHQETRGQSAERDPNTHVGSVCSVAVL